MGARLAARDPGWRRARRALRATVGAAVSLGINSTVMSIAHQTNGVALLGAVVAMISGLSVTEVERREAGLTFLLLPFIAAASVAVGAALSTHRFVADAVFVVIVFAATSLRRRGPRWSAAGFLAFMTYFFSQFLHALPAQVPWLALAATIGVSVAAFLRLVLLPERPEGALRHLVQALEGQAAALLDAAVDVLQTRDVSARLRRRVLTASGDLNRVALLVEEQLGVAPDAENPPADAGEPLRDRVFMLEVAAAHTVASVRSAVREGLSAEERAGLAREITAISRAIRSGRAPRTLARWAESTRAAANRVPISSPYRGVAHVRRALAELASAASALQSGTPMAGTRGSGPPDADLPDAMPSDVMPPDAMPLGVWGDQPEVDHSDGTPKESGPARSPDPWLGLRQGVQATVAVALAIIAGELLSPTRWYWAAIAAYIVFVGADTRGATVRRAVARTVGTLAGLVGGLVVAALVSGSKPAALVLIFVLMFAAWWLQPVSFFAGSVCVTVVLALLYVLLGTYSAHVLLLRVEETAIGAVLGGFAALVLVPARGSPALRDAEVDVLDRITDLLRAVRGRRGSGSALRALDSAFQDLRDVARPVAKGVPGAAARRVEQRIFALSAATYSARMLVTALLRVGDIDQQTADRLDKLARRAESLAATARRNEATDQIPPSQPVGGHHRSASDSSADRDLAHARVALERLDIALSRWADPNRSPLPAGVPGTKEPDGSDLASPV
ncbi:MAG TPA: FUSC family protein [Frankiaceae bacterium]|nr:FUSC family protein [Frankiaceae bacterium]